MTTSEKLYTLEEFMVLAAKEAERRMELVEGRLIEMSPTGGKHGLICSILNFYLLSFIKPRNLGWTFSEGTAFEIAPETMLCPDVSFVSSTRLPEVGNGPIRLAPDLAIEVLSPHDSLETTRGKAKRWLGAGSRLVWIVKPRRQEVEVFRPGKEPVTLTREDLVDGAEILPGFVLEINEIF